MSHLKKLCVIVFVCFGMSCGNGDAENDVADMSDMIDVALDSDQEVQDEGVDLVEEDLDPPDSEADADIGPVEPEIVTVSVPLAEVASCDDLCGGQDLDCTLVENFLGGMVAGTADYEGDITYYFNDCAALPDLEAFDANGNPVPLVTYTCNCTSGE